MTIVFRGEFTVFRNQGANYDLRVRYTAISGRASNGVDYAVPICTSQVVQGAIQFVDPEAPELPGRFYRAVPEATPPAE